MSGTKIGGYTSEDGHGRFGDWFDKLDNSAALKVTRALERMKLGNFSDEKALKGGLFEHRINFGPGYRIYYGKDGLNSIVLLSGGTKERQSEDIQKAQTLWDEYKRRKRQGE